MKQIMKKEQRNLVIGMRLNLPDFQRNNQKISFDPQLTLAFENSLKQNNYEYEILYFDENDCYKNYNLGANKIMKFLEYLKIHRLNYDNVLLADTFDVIALKEGFFETIEENNLYIGDEEEIIGCPWMYYNALPLLKAEGLYNNWFAENANKQLLNTGLIAGNINDVITLLSRIEKVILKYCQNIDSGFDMFILNYVAYSMIYNGYTIIHGKPFNTEFRKLDHYNDKCFFAHK